MHHLMMKPAHAWETLGVAAMLVGPLARLPIDLGAWFLEILARRMCETLSRSSNQK